jgi:hypothetical protein
MCCSGWGSWCWRWCWRAQYELFPVSHLAGRRLIQGCAKVKIRGNRDIGKAAERRYWCVLAFYMSKSRQGPAFMNNHRISRIYRSIQPYTVAYILIFLLASTHYPIVITSQYTPQRESEPRRRKTTPRRATPKRTTTTPPQK